MKSTLRNWYWLVLAGLVILLLSPAVACNSSIPTPSPSRLASQPLLVSAPLAPSQEKPTDKLVATTADVKVVRVVDGDTIEVLINGRSFNVRYIGIDTPETVHPSKPVEYFGKEASDKNRELVEGKIVRLEKDISETQENLAVPHIVHHGGADGIRTHYLLNANQANAIKLLNKLPVSTIAVFSKLSKGYISQVKSGYRPISPKLIETLEQFAQLKRPQTDHIKLFFQSREARGCTTKTMLFYKPILERYIAEVDYIKATPRNIEHFLNKIPPSNNNLCTRHAYFRTLKVFYNWLESEFKIDNPMVNMKPPILSKLVLHTLTAEQVATLIENVESVRDKAIIALFTESGLRLSELTVIKLRDISWESRVIRVFGKGRKEAYAPFGQLSEQYLKKWINEYEPIGNIWGITKWGIVLMLKRLEKKTSLSCNPHTFRRTFACLLRKAGIDTMTIKDLGRWESLEMVQRYTRSVTFQDSMKFYRSPLG